MLKYRINIKKNKYLKDDMLLDESRYSKTHLNSLQSPTPLSRHVLFPVPVAHSEIAHWIVRNRKEKTTMEFYSGIIYHFLRYFDNDFLNFPKSY